MIALFVVVQWQRVLHSTDGARLLVIPAADYCVFQLLPVGCTTEVTTLLDQCP